ncbi:MAG: M24 family metallopeptidase [Bacteroidota bacterium]
MSRLLLLLLVLAPLAPEAQDVAVLPMRERAAVQDQWLEHRLETVVPELMRREGIDLWIIAAREYNEDPVIETMLPATWLAARRRTVLVFHDDGETVERMAVARYDVGPFPRAWDPEAQPDQWGRVADLIEARDPQRIGINTSSLFATADGLTASEHEALLAALPERFHDRLVSAEHLSVGWLETRTEPEMATYPAVVALARAIHHAGLSPEAITPGVTTTDDLAWWYRDRVRALGLTTWFHPGVSVQRASGDERDGDFSSRDGAQVILPGDLVWVDFGISYLGLMTDTQQMAYVLRPGETEAPAGLTAGLRAANRVQDLLTGSFARGTSGNAILAEALEASRAEGLDATIYTHPIGLHGHGAGPTIGLWDQQGGVPGRGDYPLYPNTAHSIELNVAASVPEWGGQRVRFMLEEDAFFDGERVTYLDGRQTALLLIGG